MANVTHRALTGLSAAALLGLVVAAAPTTAGAEELSWRQTSIRTENMGASYVRRGVAMFSTGEPATLSFHGTSRPPAGGAMPFTGRMVLRFEDGSSFSFDAEGSVQVTSGGPGAMQMKGTLVEGSGRYAGIRGSVEMSGQAGQDVTSTGVLGDIFASGRATYTLAK